MAGEGVADTTSGTDHGDVDQTNSDGFAALAMLGLTILFIVAIVVFAIA